MRLGFLAFPALLLAPPLRGQRPTLVPPDARRLIVKVTYAAGSQEADIIGAGIIIGESADRLVIATAEHVVRPGSRGLRVVFEFAREKLVTATIVQSNRELDLAVLSVSRDSVRGYRSGLLSFDRRGSPGTRGPGALVIPVGCPAGVCWEAPASPDRVIGPYQRGVIFESFFISPGSSGGGLFNEYWEIVGMVTEKADPDGKALSIDQVLERAKAWGLPVRLRRPSVPRAGYRTSIGVAALTPTSSGSARATRSGVPSGRVTIVHQVLPAVSWHVAAMRLTPQDLVVIAGMAGVGLHLKRGRFALHPYVEAGFGQVESRHDIGGYYVAVPGDTLYVPFWSRVVGDGLGVGGGINVEVVPFPRTILEFTAGYWSFTIPVGASKLNDLFIGGGVRLGL